MSYPSRRPLNPTVLTDQPEYVVPFRRQVWRRIDFTRLS
jgi:hypothetical protein